MNQAIIRLEKIKLEKQAKVILDVADLQINEGEITGVVGPNGAGKSTLLKVMSFLERPSSGSIYFKGDPLNSKKVELAIRREIAVVFQQPLMFDTTVYNNVATGLKLRNLPAKLIKERVEYWLQRFGVEHLAKRYAHTLSGGEAQRVALARAMVYDPKVLFLDEPFSALDLPSRKRLLKDFKEVLAETKTSTVFISHDYQEIKYLCNQMAIIYSGKFIKKSSVNSLDLSGLPQDLVSFLEDWMVSLVG